MCRPNCLALLPGSSTLIDDCVSVSFLSEYTRLFQQVPGWIQLKDHVKSLHPSDNIKNTTDGDKGHLTCTSKVLSMSHQRQLHIFDQKQRPLTCTSKVSSDVPPMTTSDFRPLQSEAHNEVFPFAKHDGSFDCQMQ